LQRERRVRLSDLFTPPYTRGRLLGLFLAVLELAKTRTVAPEQEEPYGDIWLSLSKPCADPV
jgi:chromatin segregation and condensation protein Rec8/ScpA/Scc1 (kleisin family)